MRTDRDGRARYGAIELKDSLRLYWMMGLGIAIAVHLAAILSWKLAGESGTGGVPGPIVKGPVTIWIPPSIAPNLPPAIHVAEPRIKNSVGTPVPVVDAHADPEQTLAPQNQFNPQSGESPEGVTGGEEGPIIIPEEAPPPFRPVEEMPRIVRRIAPVYPELALKAGLEGTVLVKLWVDTDGKPREAAVLKSDAEIFNDAALAAAKELLFTPAYMNSGPVSVWVTIPFKFRLADRR
ncbi:MAG TPA: TonB family protein [Bacteroidota bacterium]|nr:TonB family protein [Bacteroidota bacterium]